MDSKTVFGHTHFGYPVKPEQSAYDTVCATCSGYIMDPAKVYGYSGKVCSCVRSLTEFQKQVAAAEPGTIIPVADLKSALAIQVGGSHYKSKGIQPIEYIRANNIGFFEGNAIKYLTRWKDKGGVADLHKARHYIDMLIGFETSKPVI